MQPIRSEAELWGALHWLATEYFMPDDAGRYGLPLTIPFCDCPELDRNCYHAVEAENRAYEVEQVLREAAAYYDDEALKASHHRRPSWAA